jgi:anti-sigma B factor antagonist
MYGGAMEASDRPGFRTEEVAIGSAVMVSLYGELDIRYQSHVLASLERALARHPSALAADLRGLTFMDSTGVHALIDVERRCRRQSVRFVVIRGSSTINRVLSVLGLDRLLEIVADPEQIRSLAPA